MMTSTQFVISSYMYLLERSCVRSYVTYFCPSTSSIQESTVFRLSGHISKHSSSILEWLKTLERRRHTSETLQIREVARSLLSVQLPSPCPSFLRMTYKMFFYSCLQLPQLTCRSCVSHSVDVKTRTWTPHVLTSVTFVIVTNYVCPHPSTSSWRIWSFPSSPFFTHCCFVCLFSLFSLFFCLFNDSYVVPQNFSNCISSLDLPFDRISRSFKISIYWCI